MLTEQGVFRVSILITFLVAAFGIVFGLLSGAFSIAFDGVFALADAAMTTVALGVSGLIVQSAQGDARCLTLARCALANSRWRSGQRR